MNCKNKDESGEPSLQDALKHYYKSRRDWRKEYEDAYRDANGRQVDVIESATGWFRIRTDEHNIGRQYRRKQIEQMTIQLHEYTATETIKEINHE